MARVFIGIPTYNRPDYVRETIDSLRAQSFENFRAVVSDNCSAGDAAARIARYVADLGDRRISFHRQASNGGEYGQGRFFFDRARGHELFMILHDDDVLLPGCLGQAVATLDAQPQAAFFVANGCAIGADGRRDAAMTEAHLRAHGRNRQKRGLFDVLELHLACGFAPISGVVFRRSALADSGFVDADCHGNYPFECNVFLRLGEAGCQAWFSPEELVGVRYHPGSLRSARPLENPDLVATAIKLWSRRHFTGLAERRRRAILARYYRAQAMIAARRGDVAQARAALSRALHTRLASPRAWGLAPVLLLAPGRLKKEGVFL
jgi:glycosyltransferase involved in cell wall biosynthesis